LSCALQSKPERRPTEWRRRSFQLTTKFAGDIPGYSKPKAEALFARGNERREQVVRDSRIDPWAVIRDQYRGWRTLIRFDPNDRIGRSFECVESILNQVDEDLLKPNPVCPDGKVLVAAPIDSHFASADAIAQKQQGAVDDIPYSQEPNRWRASAGKCPELGSDRADARRQFGDGPKILFGLRRMLSFQEARRIVGECPDRGDGLIDLMDYTGNDLTDRAQPVGLRQFLARQSVAKIGTLALLRLLGQESVGLAEFGRPRLHLLLQRAPGFDLHPPPLGRPDQPGKRHDDHDQRDQNDGPCAGIGAGLGGVEGLEKVKLRADHRDRDDRFAESWVSGCGAIRYGPIHVAQL
jgi:hypothetical protein